jgi:iron complex outermembrane receptor protein
MAGSSLLALLACAGAAQAAADAATPGAETTISEVIVTGTRQTGVKAVDSAAPIQVVGGEALKNVGQPDLIQTLSQNLPSFNAQGYGADTAALTLSAALRGLSPNDTLTLVNGKRRHGTSNLAVDNGSPYTGNASADLSFIPVGAIDHVEVLQDGAAAQYGSDAIAGVVNIILKTADKGGYAEINAGQYYAGDGQSISWTVNNGFSLWGKGFVNVTFEEDYHDFSKRGGCDTRFFDPLHGCALADTNPANAGIVHAPGYPNVNFIYGDPMYNIYKLFANLGYDLGGGVQFYADGSYGHRDSQAYENYRRPSKICTFDASGNCIISSEPFPVGFDPREAVREQDYAFTVGIKGKAWDWNWDLSTTYGADRDGVMTLNSGNADLFAATGHTPSQFFDGIFEATEWTSNLDISRDFAIGLASPLNVAFGGEARRNTFLIGAGDPASYFGAGAQSYPGFSPADAGNHSRTNYSAYIDLALDPITGLHIDLAGRYEDYSDFGQTEVGKVTMRYDFNPIIAVRGTVSNGFRAPTLAEEYYTSVNVAPGFALVQLPPDGSAASVAGFNKLKPELSNNYSVGLVLHPLDRLQMTIDLYQINIHDRIINSGTLLGTLCGASLPNGSCAPGQLTVVSQGVNDAIAATGQHLDSGLSYTGINIFSNAANTRTRGIEATATYASDFGEYGHVNWSIGFNYNQTDITALAPLPAPVTNVAFGQTAILTANAIAGLTTAAPRAKAVLAAYWTLGKWSVNLRDTIYGVTSEPESTDGTGSGSGAVVVRTPTTSITDLDIDYKVTPQLKLTIGANNLFDQRPPVIPLVATTSGSYAAGVRPVDGNNVAGEPLQFSPYGINGGYYYVKATVNF